MIRTLNSGDRVRIGTGFFWVDIVGTLVKRGRRWGLARWKVRLDRRFLFRRFINVRESVLVPLPASRDWLVPGQRVMVTARLMRGTKGALVRPARLLNGKRGWLVKLDHPFSGLKRTRVAEAALLPESRQQR